MATASADVGAKDRRRFVNVAAAITATVGFHGRFAFHKARLYAFALHARSHRQLPAGFVFFRVPETKGKSLKEIEASFRGTTVTPDRVR